MEKAKEFMGFGEALEVVHELAKNQQEGTTHLLSLANPEYAIAIRQRIDYQQLALDTVEDFIVNNFGDGETPPGDEPI